jgi:membrane-bound serine protease (ClpP class)
MTDLLFFFLTTFVLFSLELILPGGILGILGVALYCYSGWWSFQNFGTVPTLFFLTGSVIIHLVGIYIELQILKKTSFGNKLLLKKTITGHVNTTTGGSFELKGKEGITQTNLHPHGMILVENKSYEAYCENGFIKKGTKIKIKTSNRYKIIVQPL